MKPSRYNHFFRLESGATLAFNAASGALAEIEPAHHDRIQELIRDSGSASSPQDREFLDALIEGGYLVPDGINEFLQLKTGSRSRRRQGTTLTVTVAPTLACNFNCDYCFESRSNIRMSEQTQRAFLRFCDRHLEQAERLRICWFGGEPTLTMSIVERLQTELINLGRKHQVDIIPASIITNGYLLDEAMARRLKSLGVGDAQVTLDGPEEVHDKRRKLHNGRGTYRRIVDNLVETTRILDIGVRINVDKDNAETACRVIEDLERAGVLPRVKTHFAQVTSSGVACANIRDRCFSEEEFSESMVTLYRRLFEKGVRKIEYPRVYGGVFCGAISERSFVVSPSGDLFKCWEELSLDPEKSVGSIFDDQRTDRQRKNLETYKRWDPFALAECKECDILPVCMGGCPVHAMRADVESRGVCSPWKFNLAEMLELRYRCEEGAEVNP